MIYKWAPYVDRKIDVMDFKSIIILHQYNEGMRSLYELYIKVYIDCSMSGYMPPLFHRCQGNTQVVSGVLKTMMDWEEV